MINALCVVGLLPFLLIHMVQLNYISMVIFINGLVYHSSYNTPANMYLRYYDIAANLIFIIWVNIYTEWQPQTVVISLLSAACFAANFYFNPSVYMSDVAHIIFVQFPLAIALFHYGGSCCHQQTYGPLPK